MRQHFLIAHRWRFREEEGSASFGYSLFGRGVSFVFGEIFSTRGLANVCSTNILVKTPLITITD